MTLTMVDQPLAHFQPPSASTSGFGVFGDITAGELEASAMAVLSRTVTKCALRGYLIAVKVSFKSSYILLYSVTLSPCIASLLIS